MRTTVHVGTDADARLAIDAGANGLEHTARGLSDDDDRVDGREEGHLHADQRRARLRVEARRRRRRGRRCAAAWRCPAILQSAARPELAAGAVPARRRDGRPAGAGVCRLDRPDVARHSRRRADPGRIGRRQSRDLPRRVAHSRARAAGAGGHAARRRAEVRDVAPGRSPRPVHARPHLRRRGGRPRACSRRDPTERVDAYRRVVSVYLGGRKLDRRPGSPRRRRAPGVRVYAEDRHGNARRSATLRELGMGDLRLADLLAAVSCSRRSTRASRRSRRPRCWLATSCSWSLYFAGTSCAARASCGSSRRSTSSRSRFSPRNPSAATFFIYGAAMLGHAFPPQAAHGVLAGQVRRRRRRVGGAGHADGGTTWPAVISALIGAVTIQAAPSRRRREAAAGAGRSRTAREARRARAHRARSARRARPHAVGGRAEERAGAKADDPRSRRARAGDGGGRAHRARRPGRGAAGDHRLSLVGARRGDRSRARDAGGRRHRADDRSAADARSRRRRKPRCRSRCAKRRPTSSATPAPRAATSASTRRTARC